MKPTVTEQLAGVARLVDQLLAAPELTDTSRDLALAASRQLARVVSSLPARAPFLAWDNRAMETLLGEIEPILPESLRSLVSESLSSESSGSPVDGHIGDASMRNDSLRSVLAAIVEDLPEGELYDSIVPAIAAHLRMRATANPALHKRPARPWEPNEELAERPENDDPAAHADPRPTSEAGP